MASKCSGNTTDAELEIKLDVVLFNGVTENPTSNTRQSGVVYMPLSKYTRHHGSSIKCCVGGMSTSTSVTRVTGVVFGAYADTLTAKSLVLVVASFKRRHDPTTTLNVPCRKHSVDGNDGVKLDDSTYRLLPSTP